MSSYVNLVLYLFLSTIIGETVGFWPFYTHVDALASGRPQGKQVAIIGAGAAGSSTAYHLHKLALQAGIDVNITVFEQSSHIGGRSTTVNAYNDPSHPVELGASIFVKVNKILMDATAEFNLQADTQGDEADSQTLGIWNGETFVFTQSSTSPAWWDTAKLLWKYGMSPIRTNNLMKATVGKFLKLYEAPFFPFRSLSARAVELDLVGTTGVTGAQLLEQNKIYAPFTRDIIQASTRVNYGQNLGRIHGLETMVCMAIEGAVQIKGGNWQIFDRMLNDSGATVLLDTAVSSLQKDRGLYTLVSAPVNGTITLSQQFDTVVLAAPFQFSGIKIAEGLATKLPDEIPYVKLHVTLFASPLKINGAHFDLTPKDVVPDTILTTLSPSEDWSSDKEIVGKAGFFSISTLRRVLNPHTNSTEYVYKIFSPEPIEPSFLASLFGIPTASLPDNLDDLAEKPTESITWYYPKTFYSYPYEYPRVTFEEVELARGLWYTSGIESFISTMETSALMGKNVAQLILDDYLEVLGPEHVVAEL